MEAKLFEDETRNILMEISSTTNTNINKLKLFSTYLLTKFNYYRIFKILRMNLMTKNWKNSTHGKN